MATTKSSDNTILALFPPHAPDATTPVVGAVYGVPKHVYDLKPMGLTIVVVVLTATIFSLLGFINAVFARNFDDISIIPTFVLTPLTYLGGVFYSITLLPPFWQSVSLANPVLHMVNAFRYGILGVSDIKISVALTFMVVATIVLYIACARLLVSGRGMRQ